MIFRDAADPDNPDPPPPPEIILPGAASATLNPRTYGIRKRWPERLP
jgi:hypothetical protein